MDIIKVTRRVRQILGVLVDEDRDMTALQICQHAKLWPGTLYPALARLERCGWIEGFWGVPWPPPASVRPRFYRLTPYGNTKALALFRRYAWQVSYENPETIPFWAGGRP